MVDARVSEAYIHFTIIYLADHILSILQIKDLINEDGEMTTSFKYAIVMIPSISHLRVLFFPCVVRKDTA